MHRHIFAVALSFAALSACRDEPDKPAREPPEEPPKPERPAHTASASSAAPATAPLPNPPSDGPSSDSAPSDSPSASASARSKQDAAQACPAAPEDAPRLKLVELKLTSKLENKKPADEVTLAKPGSEIYAYLTVKNSSKTERCMLVTFRVNDRLRAALTLDVGPSPAWRTWAHVKVNDGDAGATIHIDVTDDQGHTHAHEKVLVEP